MASWPTATLKAALQPQKSQQSPAANHQAERRYDETHMIPVGPHRCIVFRTLEVCVGTQVQGSAAESPELWVLSCCAAGLALGDLSRSIDHCGQRRIEEKDMSLSEAVVAHVDGIMKSSALVPRDGFHLEPRCRVCRN